MQNELFEFKYNVLSEAKVKVVTVKWTIIDFRKLMDLQENIKTIAITKAHYADDIDADSKFELMLTIVGKDRELVEISYLAPVPSYIKCSMFYVGANGVRNSAIAIRHDRAPTNQWQLIAVALKQDLCNSGLIQGRLPFEVNFFMNKNIPVEDKYEKFPQNNLVFSLENLLKDSSLSDVTLKSIEDVKLFAHKAILAVRSPVFKAHFDHGTKESLTSIIECQFETEVLEEVLQYIYTNMSPKLDVMPEKILIAADYYQLEGLKVLSERVLHEKLSVENAIQTLELADLHSALNLKNFTLKFINTGNHVEAIIKTEGWAKLQSVNLIKSIYEFKYNHNQPTNK